MKNPSSYLYPQNEEYQRTENIATDGRAYIKTGYKPFFDGSSGTRVQCVLENCAPIDGKIFGNDDIGFFINNGKYTAKYSDQEKVMATWHHWTPNPVYRNLPKEYQQVEYLKSDGTQIIGTKVFTENGAVRLELSVMTNYYMIQKYNQSTGGTVTTINEDYLSNIFGTDSTFRLWFQILQASSYQIGGYFAKLGDAAQSSSSSGSPLTSPNANFGQRYNIIFDSINHIFSIDAAMYTRNVGTFEDSELYLFNVVNSEQLSTGLFGNIYSAKLYQQINEETVLVRDFVPCRRILDDKPGMYDLVDGMFFENDALAFSDENTELTDFTCGSDVPERIVVLSSSVDYSDKIFTVDLSNEKFRIVHEGLEETFSFTSPGSFTSEEPFYIFAANTIDAALQPVKIRRFKIFSGTDLIHDFIPAYWNLNNDPGLYDLIGGNFYVNENKSTITKVLNEANGWTIDFTGGYTRTLNEANGDTLDIL